MSTTVVKGNRVTGTTGTYNPTWPSSAGGAWGAGDWGVVLVGTKPTTAPTVAAFGTSGGTKSAVSANGTPMAAGAGDTCIMARWGKLAGTEGGTTVTVTDSDDSVTWAQCYVIHSTIGFDNTVRQAWGADNNPGVAGAAGSFQAACGGDATASWQAGDTILCAANVPASSPSPMWSAEGFTCAGVTFASVTEQDENASGSGNNICGVVTSAKVDTGSASGGPTVTFTATAGTANSYGPALILGFRELSAPGQPENVDATTPTAYSAELTWTAPITGGPVTSYEVRIDAGAWTDVGLVLAHTFTGLTPVTYHELEVRAVGPGGTGPAWLIAVSTPEAPDPSWYRVEIDLGDGVDTISWSVERGDAPTYGPRLPLTMGWDISDTVESFPAQPNMPSGSFQVLVPDAALLSTVVKGSTCLVRMFTTSDPVLPWQELVGVVSQLEGQVTDAGDFLATVYVADDAARLADIYVGYTTDWPIEHVDDRLARICTEAGLTLDTIAGTGREAWLPARAASSPITVLDAVKACLKDTASKNTSEPPDTWYGRYVYWYVHADATLVIRAFERRVYPDSTTTLDGDLVGVPTASWVKAPGAPAAAWVIVDDAVFGTPSGVPYVRTTSLLDWTGDPPGSETNWTAITRDNLGNSLLPDGSTQLDGWGARVLRYRASDNPDPVMRWVSPFDAQVHPVVITPLRPELELNGGDYLAGTLTGARLTIPTDGDYYVDVRLRPELLPGTDLPA